MFGAVPGGVTWTSKSATKFDIMRKTFFLPPPFFQKVVPFSGPENGTHFCYHPYQSDTNQGPYSGPEIGPANLKTFGLKIQKNATTK